MIMIAAMLTIAASASAMSYRQAREQALFLADKMAYELNLTEEQYEAAYQINLDYLMAIDDYNDLYGTFWRRRNLELQSILAPWQYDAYITVEYFYHPLYWTNNAWYWPVYDRYTPTRYYYVRPKVYVSYKGGNHRSYYTSRKWTQPTTRVLRTAPQNQDNRTFGNGKRLDTGTANRSFGSGNRNSATTTRSTTAPTTTTTRSFGNGSRVSSSTNGNAPAASSRIGTSVVNRSSAASAASRQSVPVRNSVSSQAGSSTRSFGGSRQATTSRPSSSVKSSSGAIGGHR